MLTGRKVHGHHRCHRPDQYSSIYPGMYRQERFRAGPWNAPSMWAYNVMPISTDIDQLNYVTHHNVAQMNDYAVITGTKRPYDLYVKV
ncbi:hypothetical protein IC229_09555 [Spirosoma sp. BT702]|uniref:Uncharacterized protein n=1 Tax=Spirosoma profusum TaxID=2771354 RepID=A0A926XUU2_9BACT|nr:hypothetical protein [Spirosoma profusum]MBD2700883.1 hypothetical protein [Spirosoma profusum]